MKKDIFEGALEISGAGYISDLRELGERLPEVLAKLEYEHYAAEDVKKLMVYIFGKYQEIGETQNESIYSAKL